MERSFFADVDEIPQGKELRESVTMLPGELSQGQLVAGPANAGTISVNDGIISAQRVAVERDEQKILNKLKIMASMAGDKYYYRFPVKSKNGSTNYIEGPTIKLANDLSRIYGNCLVDARVFDNGDNWIFYARFVDIETGYSLTRAYQQRKGQKTINTKDAGRALDQIFQIGQSKAQRNVICKALESYTDFALEIAHKSIVERIGKNLGASVEKAKNWLAEMRVDVRRVEKTVGKTADQWTAPDVARVVAEMSAVRDGMAIADEIWPPDPLKPTSPPSQSGATETKAKQAPPSPDTTQAEPASSDEEPELPAHLDRSKKNSQTNTEQPDDDEVDPDFDWSTFERDFVDSLWDCTTLDELDELHEENAKRIGLGTPEQQETLGKKIATVRASLD